MSRKLKDEIAMAIDKDMEKMMRDVSSTPYKWILSADKYDDQFLKTRESFECCWEIIRQSIYVGKVRRAAKFYCVLKNLHRRLE